MIFLVDKSIEHYSKAEINALKREFAGITDFDKRVHLYDRFIGIEFPDFSFIVDRFEFPFPNEKQHQAYEVEHMEKIFSMTPVLQQLTKSYRGVTFSILPNDPLEWAVLNRYVMDHKFITLEKLKDAFEDRLKSVPDKPYFTQAQIEKFGSFLSKSRHDVIPFYKEFYNVFAQDPPPLHPHLNRWYPIFAGAFEQARKEGARPWFEESVYTYQLYFAHLGYVYAHYLGYLRQRLEDLKEGGEHKPAVQAVDKDSAEREANEKDKLPHKAQILLLHRLGILDLPIFSALTDIQKGKLFGHLLNRSDDNTENYIRYRNGKKVEAKYKLDNANATKLVENLLRDCGLDKL